MPPSTLGLGNTLTKQDTRLPGLLLDKYDGAAAAYSLRKLRRNFGSEGAAGPDLSLTNNGVTQGSGKVGNAGVFDGASDLEGGTDEEYQPDTAITFEAWVYLEDRSTERTVASNYNGGDGMGWEVSVGSGGNMIFYLHSGSGFIFPKGGTVSVDEWRHLVARWDGSTAELFINGTSVASEAFSNVAPSTYNWLIGDTQGPGGLWEGRIGPVRLWNGRSLTNTEITTLFNSDSGLSLSNIESDYPALLDDLVSAYEFNDSNNLGADSWFLNDPILRGRRDVDDVKRDVGLEDGGVDETELTNFANGGDVDKVQWEDQSENDIDAVQSVLANQPSVVISGGVLNPGAKDKPAAEFSGGRYLSLSSAPSGDLKGVIAWVYLDAESDGSGSNMRALFADPSAIGPSVIFERGTADSLSLSIQDANSNNTGIASTIPSGYHHIGLIWDGANYQFVLNGIERDNEVENASLLTQKAWDVGYRSVNTDLPLEGHIHTLVFFSETIGVADVQKHYEKTKGEGHDTILLTESNSLVATEQNSEIFVE